MTFGNEPRDASADEVPISTSYVPNTGFVAVQGSPTTNTDSSSNTSTPVNLNLTQIGNTLFTLGQALKNASVPVTLASDQGTIPTLDTNSAAIKADLDAILADTADIETNTGLLALESGGNLASLVANTADLLADGDHLATIDTSTAASKTDLDTLAGIVSGGKAATKAATNDIVDLATLLTLAGTPTDANTINSLMGRLTKIRDLLNATLTVQGTITEANSSSINTHVANVDTATTDLVADLDTLITNTTGLATQSTLASAKTDLDTLVTNTADLLADGDNLATIATNTGNAATIEGATNDAAVVGDNTGTISAKLRGLSKIFNDIWDSVNHLFAVNIKQINGQVPTMGNTDGATAASTVAEGALAWNNSSWDRIRTLQGKGTSGSQSISSGGGVSSTSVTMSSAPTGLQPSSPVTFTGGTAEVIYTASNYVAAANPIVLATAIANSGHTNAQWDTFNWQGPGQAAVTADGVLPSALLLFDPNSGNYLIPRMATQDSSGMAAILGAAPYLINTSGNADRQRGNLDNISLLASAARTTTQTVSDQTNYNGRGVIVVLDMTVVGTSSVTLEIDGKDPVSGKYYSILTGAAVVTNSTNIYKVYPGITAATNAAASDILPRTWRVVVTANNANSATYSVGAIVIL